MKKNDNKLNDLYQNNWSEWKSFPNPEKGEYLCAPLGCGVYQLKNVKTKDFVLFGRSKHVACRMSSLLLSGCGTRENEEKKNYVTTNLHNIEYRTMPLHDEKEIKEMESYIKTKESYLFDEKHRRK